jgi:hypothetical protein
MRPEWAAIRQLAATRILVFCRRTTIDILQAHDCVLRCECGNTSYYSVNDRSGIARHVLVNDHKRLKQIHSCDRQTEYYQMRYIMEKSHSGTSTGSRKLTPAKL